MANLYEDTAEPAIPTPALDGDARADVAVVGGGITGLSTALHLAELGAKVVVLEAEQPGWGASGRNGGQVNPGLKHDPDTVERDFGRDLGGRMNAFAGAAPAIRVRSHRAPRHSMRCAPQRHLARGDTAEACGTGARHRGAACAPRRSGRIAGGLEPRAGDRHGALSGRHAGSPRRGFESLELCARPGARRARARAPPCTAARARSA